MSKNLLKICLYLEYYKDYITDLYGVTLTDIALDNDVLDNLTKRLYVTTLDKQIKMEQENKQLKETINKVMNYINKEKIKCYVDCGEYEAHEDIYLDEIEIDALLKILKEVTK